MTVTIKVNDLTVIHRASGGIAIATAPDVCLTPGGPPVPVPYPNIALSKDLAKGTSTVLVDGRNSAAIRGSEYSRSTGDEPGTAGGVASGVNRAEATWITSSMNVKMDGAAVCRLTDKMLMNHGNTVCLGGNGNGNTGSGKGKASRKKEPKVCATEPMTVKCGHQGSSAGKRAYKLEHPSRSRSESGVPANVLQVVAGPTQPDMITAATRIKKTPCQKHIGNVLVLEGDETSRPPTQTKTRLSFPATAHEHYETGIFRHIWPYPAKLSHHRVKPVICNPAASGGVEIQVFPDIKWEAAVSADFSRKYSAKKGAGSVESEGKDGSLELRAGFTRDGHEIGLSYEHQQKFEDAFRAIQFSGNTARQFLGFVNKVGAVEIELALPSVEMKGTWGYEESADSNSVDYVLEATLSLNPLIGLKGTVDILDFILPTIQPPIGSVLKKAKDYAERGVDVGGVRAEAEMSLNLSAYGEICGDLLFRGHLGKVRKGSAEGGIKAHIEVAIEAKIKGSLERAEVRLAYGELSGAVKSGIFARLGGGFDEKGIYLCGSFGWDGITFTYAAYVGSDVTIKSFAKKTGAKVSKGFHWAASLFGGGQTKKQQPRESHLEKGAGKKAGIEGEVPLVEGKNLLEGRSYLLGGHK